MALSRLVGLFRRHPLSSTRQLAQLIDRGERRLRQRFEGEIGISAKRWLSLMRMNRFLWSLHPNTEAAVFEFSDDSHAIREFKCFAGMTPGAYLLLKATGDPLVNTGRNLPLF